MRYVEEACESLHDGRRPRTVGPDEGRAALAENEVDDALEGSDAVRVGRGRAGGVDVIRQRVVLAPRRGPGVGVGGGVGASADEVAESSAGECLALHASRGAPHGVEACVQ